MGLREDKKPREVGSGGIISMAARIPGGIAGAGTQHRLSRNMFDPWLRRPGGSPADAALKTRLKELLGDVA
jgi:hypothetical protein